MESLKLIALLLIGAEPAMTYLGITIGAIGVTITTSSLIFAIMTNYDRRKWEKVVRINLKGIAGNSELIRKNAHWADKHFKELSTIVLNNNEEIDRAILGEHIQAGARDVVAAERMLRIHRNNILSLQEGLFGTREIETFDIANVNPTYGKEETSTADDLPPIYVPVRVRDFSHWLSLVTGSGFA